MTERPDIFALNGDVTIGLMKDECPGKIISEAFNIRAKTYYYIISDGSTKSKHKSVSKEGMETMAKNTYPDSTSLMTQVYRDCLFENKVFHTKNIEFQSKDYILSLIESEKKVLCLLNLRNWILSDGIMSWAYDYWRINAYKSMIKAGMSPKLAEKRSMMIKLKP